MNWNEWLGEENELGLSIANKKYRHANETFEDFLHRACNGNEKLMKLYREKKALLGGRTNANRGLDTGGSYMNCYSSGYVPDDYREIMKVATNIGITFKGQGGQGVSMSKLRPKGSPIGKTYTSDGIIPFMKVFNEVTDATSQGGSRKGALMISLDARHKEALDFIHVKSGLGIIEKANLSLEIDDEFMEAVQKYYETGEVVTLHESRDYSGHLVEYDVVPIDIFKALVDNCYDWGDPAALFVNRFRNYNLMEFVDDYQIETCNPCGEQPLPRAGACCLGSINLSEFVKEPYSENAWFDFKDFQDAVDVMIEALDDIVEENYSRHPLKEQQEMSYNYRNIGLGVFGYATMLMKMGMRYGSRDALTFTDNLFRTMFKTAVYASSRLAEERGCFPMYSDKVWDSEIIKRHFTQLELDILKESGLRNCSLLSVAPTGSLANLLGESGGCEAEYAISYTRRTVGMTDGEDTYYEVYCKAAREWREKYPEKELPDYFVASEDIPWRDRVATQAVMQQHVDTAISSTVNLPEEATKDDIAGIYLEAWNQGCKGITIFRNNCKRLGILTTGVPKDTKNESTETVEAVTEAPTSSQGHSEGMDICVGSGRGDNGLSRGTIIKASDRFVGKKRTLRTGCGTLHCEAFFDPDNGELREVYLSKGSTGGCGQFMVGLSRMVSLAARGGIDIEDIVDQLKSSGTCPSYAVRRATHGDTSVGSSCPVAVGNALIAMHEEMIQQLNFGLVPKVEDKTTVAGTHPFLVKRFNINVPKCPECGGDLVFEGGCCTCKQCGYSKCD